VEPLNAGGNQFGCIIFETRSSKTDIYGALVRQISSALQDSLLLQKHRQTEEILIKQAEELTRSNEELQRFAYVASHDLQEPLRTVTNYVQLLARRYKGKLDPDADKFINFAVDGATRMYALINDLLTYSRLATQGQPFELTDCAMVMDRVLDNLKLAIEETKADISVDNLPVLMIDGVQMIQLLQNLIENAIKFHRQNVPPKIHVHAEMDKDEWLFSVQDNGIGIEPQYFEQIFVVFRRLHNRDKYEGTGIGLAICKRIVERHGGHIWIESEPGKGSTFFFTIPERNK
jgi:light-regulated signal transduction histidine kinase (bacteriophytochrome)